MTDPWSAAKRREAWIAVEIAATRREAAERTLAYMVRAAISHGLTVDDVCTAGDLTREHVMQLADPAVA